MRDFSFFNKDEFRNDLKNIKFDEIHSATDVNSSVIKLFNSIIYLLDEHAPYKTVTKREKSLKIRPWISYKIRKQMKHRDYLFRKYCTARNPTLKLQKYELYKESRNAIKRKISKAKKAYYNTFFERHKTNTIKPWSGIKSIVSFKPKPNSHPTSLLYDGKLENNPQIISDIFAELFTNIGPHIAKQIPKSLKSFKNYIGSNNLNSFYLNPTTPNEIEKIIKKFKMGKALGPNSIPVNILKANAEYSCRTYF